MEGAVALVLALLSIPFILPLISWFMARKVRARVDDLEARIAEQDERIQRLTVQLNKLKETGVAAPAPAATTAPAPTPRAAAIEQRPPTLASPPVTEAPPRPVTPS